MRELTTVETAFAEYQYGKDPDAEDLQHLLDVVDDKGQYDYDIGPKFEAFKAGYEYANRVEVRHEGRWWCVYVGGRFTRKRQGFWDTVSHLRNIHKMTDEQIRAALPEDNEAREWI